MDPFIHHSRLKFYIVIHQYKCHLKWSFQLSLLDDWKIWFHNKHNWPYFIYHSRFVEKKPKSTLVLDDNKFQSNFVQIDKNQLTKKKIENLSTNT